MLFCTAPCRRIHHNGRRIAFDRDRGHLYVIRAACIRWTSRPSNRAGKLLEKRSIPAERARTLQAPETSALLAIDDVETVVNDSRERDWLALELRTANPG